MISFYEIFRTLLICIVLFIATYLIVVKIAGTTPDVKIVREQKFNIFHALMHDGTTSLPTNSSITCPELPSSLLGSLPVSLDVPSEGDIVQANPNVKEGGWFHPVDCRARQKVAIIIPYRNRSEHLQFLSCPLGSSPQKFRTTEYALKTGLLAEIPVPAAGAYFDVLLNNLHPFLQRQRLEYVIFVVEQAGGTAFNRGKLLNIGFIEATKRRNFDCFILHDTDLIPENDLNLYACSSQPTLLSVAISKFQYKSRYATYFGGVICITKEHFTAVNGYSNLYWGWGNEDEDLSERVRYRFGSIFRPHPAIGRYTMIRPDQDTLNPTNILGQYLSKSALSRAAEDGLNNLHYQIVRTETRALYTRILVDIGQPPAVVRLSDGSIGFVDNGRMFQLDRCTWNENGTVVCRSL